MGLAKTALQGSNPLLSVLFTLYFSEDPQRAKLGAPLVPPRKIRDRGALRSNERRILRRSRDRSVGHQARCAALCGAAYGHRASAVFALVSPCWSCRSTVGSQARRGWRLLRLCAGLRSSMGGGVGASGILRCVASIRTTCTVAGRWLAARNLRRLVVSRRARALRSPS